MENTKDIPLNWIFSKWFVYEDNNINTNITFWKISKNTRNGIWTLKNRKWYKIKWTLWTELSTYIKNIDNIDSKLLIEYNWKIFLSDSNWELYTDKWSINTWSSTTNIWSSIKTIWDIAIIANGWDMQYYDKKDSLLKTITNPYNDIWDVWETEKDSWDRKDKFTTVMSNNDASIIISAAKDWYIYKSIDWWETFSQKWAIAWYINGCMSDTWQYIYLLAYTNKLDTNTWTRSWLFKSSDYGETFTQVLANNTTFWYWIACSKNWNIIYISWNDDDWSTWKLLKSTDYWVIFTELWTWKRYMDVACDENWTKFIATVAWWKIQYSSNWWTNIVEKWEVKSWWPAYISRDWKLMLFAEWWNLYRSDNDLDSYIISAISDEFSTIVRPFTCISWSTKYWYILASIYNWPVLWSFDFWITWDTTLTETDNYLHVHVNEDCNETDWIFLTASYNWYIKRSKNTITFNPSIIEIYNRRLFLAWFDNKKSTMVVSQGFIVNERDLIDFWPNKIRKPILSVREWDIIWIKASQSNLYLFDTKWVMILSWYSNDWITPIFQYIDKNTIPYSNKTIVSADNLVFLLTKDKKIKSIWYEPWITNPQIAEISNIPWMSIQEWMTENLDDNQDTSFWYFYDPEKLVMFFVTLKNWDKNVIVYDMVNQTFHIDENREFSCSTNLNWKYYVWSINNWNIFEDNIWNNDNWTAITCERETKYFDFWDWSIQKIMRELRLSWMIDLNTTIHMKLYADEVLVYDEIITSSIVDNTLYWNKTENKLYQFRKEISKWDIYARWYNYKVVFTATWNSESIWFVLNSLNTRVQWVWQNSKNELFEK